MKGPSKGADILAIGFAATVTMWSLLYVAALPPGSRAVWVIVIAAIIACLFAAGYAAGRLAGRGWTGGAGLGAFVTAVNLLILLSLLGADQTGATRSASWWILGFLAASVVLGALGAALGKRGEPRGGHVNWTAVLACVTAITTLLMLVAGGIVTGLEAGLAVEGWIIAEGHFLVLFPITLMQRDVGTFVEHAHRLLGLLVGLMTIVLMVNVWMVDRRWWLRWLTVAVLLAVIGQGVLGGTRVTEQSVLLGIVHGVFAPVIFAAMVAVAMVTWPARLADDPPLARATVPTDRTLAVVLLAVIGVQIALGTAYRHLQPVPEIPPGALAGTLHGHSFVGSTLVLLITLMCAVRACGLYAEKRAIKRAGMMLISTVMLQVALGIASFIVVPKGARAPDDPITGLEVGITTAHQVTGAVLLAGAVSLYVWQRRVLADSLERSI